MRRLLRHHPGALLGVVGFALTSLLLTSLVARTLSRSAGGETVRVDAEFRDAAGLRVGDDVRIAGVRVGRVADTRLEDGLAVVTLEVERDQAPDAATTASIDFLNLMGQRYVGLQRGTGPGGRTLGDGDRIPVARTRPALDLTAMFNAFKPLFDSIRPADVNDLAANLVQTLQGQGPTIRDLLRQTAGLTGTVLEREAVIDRVVDNLTLVLRTAQDHRAEIVGLVDDLGSLTHGLAQDRQAIGATMDSVSDLTSLADGLLTEVEPHLVRGVRALQQTSRFLAGSTGSLGRALAGIPTQLGIYLRTLGYGSYLNVYVCNLWVQLTGTPGVELLDTGDRHTERCR